MEVTHGITSEVGFSHVYKIYWFGVKDGMHWLGDRIDDGLNCAVDTWESLNELDLGQALSDFGEMINPFNWDLNPFNWGY